MTEVPLGWSADASLHDALAAHAQASAEALEQTREAAAAAGEALQARDDVLAAAAEVEARRAQVEANSNAVAQAHGQTLAARDAAQGVAANVQQVMSDAAAAVAPAVGNAIRTEVEAAADRAEAASRAFLPVYQTGAALPTRPAVEVVHWYSWTDPTDAGAKVMDVMDLWFELPQPSAAAQIPDEAWRIYNRGDGQSAVLRVLLGPPRQNPPITAYEYRLNTGAPVAIPMTPGETIIPGLGAGQTYAVEARQRNFVDGEWSAIRPLTIASNSGIFTDDFNRTAGQAITATGSWYAMGTTPTLRILTGGKIGSRNTDARDGGLANFYVPSDQFAELTIESAAKHHSDKENGIYLLLRAKVIGGRLSAIGLRYAAPTSAGGMPWVHLFRFVDGVATRIGGVGGQVPPLVGPERLRVSVVGDVVTAARNDTVLFSQAITGFSHGDAGLLMVQDNNSELNIADDFLAGPTT